MRIPALVTRQNLAPPTSAVMLDDIRVASPCPASWAAMTGDDRLRHCKECKLNVYNLSEMTRAEAEQLIASREGRLCVRFYRRADGTILTRDCPRGLRVVIGRVSRFAGTFLSAMIAVTPAFTQSPASAGSQVQPASQDKDAQLGLEVMVLDPTNAVIQNAKVTLCRCKRKVTNDATTDATGVAHFAGLSKGSYEIRVAAPGFKTLQRTLTIKKPEQLQLKLQIAEHTVTVEVKAESGEVMGTVMMGMVTETQPFRFPPVPAAGGRPGPLR